MKKYFKTSAKVIGQCSVGAALLLLSSIAAAGPPAPIPEPGPFGLLLLGGVALFVAKRFRRNK